MLVIGSLLGLHSLHFLLHFLESLLNLINIGMHILILYLFLVKSLKLRNLLFQIFIGCALRAVLGMVLIGVLSTRWSIFLLNLERPIRLLSLLCFPFILLFAKLLKVLSAIFQSFLVGFHI